MKNFYRYLFTVSIVIGFIGFFNFNNLQKKLTPPLLKVAGTKDHPSGAAEHRYNMIKGKADILDPTARQRAIDYTRNNLIATSLNKNNNIDSWTALGPGNIGGRIRSIVINPTNSNEMLIGAVAGGIWKTTDGGITWSPKIDDGNPISIGCMVNDGQTVYAGTGEGWWNTDAVYGGGIYKSTDFGDTWTLLPSTIAPFPAIWNFRNVRQLRIDPDGNILAVTLAYNYKGGVGRYYTNGGLYKSSDGGNSWTKIADATSPSFYNGADVIPISSSVILYALNSGNGMYRTTDGGTNWTALGATEGLPTTNYGRIAMTQDPNNTNTVYAVFAGNDSNDGLEGIYKTVDAGLTWTALTKPGNLNSTGSSYLGHQGWYDNVIVVDPHNSNNIYVGGVEDMKSTDGGNTWQQLTVWHPYYQVPQYGGNPPYVHADHHAIIFDPSTAGIIYDGNDGGIFKTTDGGGNWDDLNNGLEITQYYGGAVAASGTNYQGGTQDNGHHRYNGAGTDWTEVRGGDGGYAAISQTNPNICYEEYVNLQIDKSTDGGNTWEDAENGLNRTGALFIAPFAMNPENSDVLIAGSSIVNFTTDAATNWSASSTVLSSEKSISAVTVVNATSPYLAFAGTTDGKVFMSTAPTLPAASSSLAKTNATWNEITPPGNNGAWVRRITVDLNNKQNIYVCYSGYNNTSSDKHVYYSPDQGTTWQDISGNLPDVPVHSLVIDNNNAQTLYIGTETGVYETNDRGGNWIKKGTGMPDFVPVDELVLQSGTDELFAFTHGRSVFKTNSPLPVELTSFSINTTSNSAKLNWKTITEVNNFGFEVERKIDKNDWKKIGFVEGHGNSNSTKSYSFTDNNLKGREKIYYRLKQIDIDGSHKYSNIVESSIIVNSFELLQNYPNPFNPTTNIKYKLNTVTNVTLKIYNALGKEIMTLINEKQNQGIYDISFDGSNLASGIYYYSIKTDNQSEIRKMMLLK